MEAYRLVLSSGPDYDWIESEEFSYFIRAWYDLKSYYEESDDDVVGAEVMSTLIDVVRSLWTIARNPDIDAIYRESAFEKVESLEIAVQLALWEAVNNFYHNDKK